MTTHCARARCLQPVPGEAASHVPRWEIRAREGTSSPRACSSQAPEGGPPAPRPLECPLPQQQNRAQFGRQQAEGRLGGAGRGCTHLRKSSMWTTAGAIFSTTSAMKLNLYRGLVSWWRPAGAGGSRCSSETRKPPRAAQGGAAGSSAPAPPGDPEQHSDTQTLGNRPTCRKEWLMPSFLAPPRWTPPGQPGRAERLGRSGLHSRGGRSG